MNRPTDSLSDAASDRANNREQDAKVKKTLIEACLNRFQNHFADTVSILVRNAIDGIEVAPDVCDIEERCKDLRSNLNNVHNDWLPTHQYPFVDMEPKSLSIFKEAILRGRRVLAEEAEQRVAKTTNAAVMERMEKDCRTLDTMVMEQWFQKIDNMRLPRAVDYIPIDSIATAFPELETTRRDEKFRILQAPTQFPSHLKALRSACEIRERPLAIGFVDIDDFKRFNTEYTEHVVDRRVLPRFMQAMESHVFRHGYAYRYGGDEYLILLPNLSMPLALEFFDELRMTLAALQFTGVQERTTVSIGMCCVAPDSPLTNNELLARANAAKKFAKENGKNRVAVVECGAHQIQSADCTIARQA